MSNLDYAVSSKFQGGIGTAFCRGAEIPLDAALEERPGAFNPAELLLAAVSACMTKGALRAAKINHIDIRAIEVRLKGGKPYGECRLKINLINGV